MATVVNGKLCADIHIGWIGPVRQQNEKSFELGRKGYNSTLGKILVRDLYIR